MTLDERRACLNRAEASLRETAEQLIRFPLDPGRACTALENAKSTLEAVRKGCKNGSGDVAEVARRVRREATRVQSLLDAAAMVSARCFSGTGVCAVSYTSAGEFRVDPQVGSLAIQA
jgi:hypothetical protein